MKKLIIILIILLSSPVYAFRVPGTSKHQNINDYISKAEENDVENSRDYSGGRPASLNKKPWLSDNLIDMESLTWPSLPDRDYNDTGGGDDQDFRYYSSSCWLSGPRAISGDSCGPPIQEYGVDIKSLRTGSIITGYRLQGPGQVVKANISSIGSGVNFKIKPYDNANSAKIRLIVSTISDEDTQDIERAFDIYRSTGEFPSAQDLIESREDAERKYMNVGCELTTYVRCEECQCQGIEPTIYASSATISPGGSITLYVNSGGLACPTYTWQVSGTGFSLNQNTTENDLETVTLSSDSGTCGVDYDAFATITVTDSCGIENTIEIRNSAGSWVDQGNPFDTKIGPLGCSITLTQILTATSYDETEGQYKWDNSGIANVFCGIISPAPCDGWDTYYSNSDSIDMEENPPCGSPSECGEALRIGTCPGTSTMKYARMNFYKWECP